MSLSDYQPSRATRYLHRIPRFGHSRSIASLISTDSIDDYNGGVRILSDSNTGIIFDTPDSQNRTSFSRCCSVSSTQKVVAFYVFLLTILFLWTVVLMVLKFYYGIHRVGCAAGGDVVDVKEMKKVYNLDKFERKQRILRNWRIQTTCLITCIALLPCTILTIKFGLDPFINSLHGIHEMNDHIESHAYRGIQAVAQLQNSYNNLQTIQNSDVSVLYNNISLHVDVGCINNSSNISSLTGNLSLVGNHSNVTKLAVRQSTLPLQLSDIFDWQSLQDEITSTVTKIASYDFNGANSVLYQITNGTTVIDAGIDTLKNHDWTIRFLVVILDVIIIFMIVGILFVKDNVDYPAYQSFASFILIPIFCLTLVATLVEIYFFTSISVLNADFCSGGNTYGYDSPMGTIREVIEQYGYAANTFPYRAMQFYEEDCLGEDPFETLKKIKSTVVAARLHTSKLIESATGIVSECNGSNNISAFSTNGTLYTIGQDLSNIEGSMKSVLDLIDCSNISPILRQLLFGSTCTDSVRGLASLYSLLLLITLLGFIVLSTRAALYNPVIRGRRNKRREKEFEDYKMYMSEFYDSVNWDINCVPEVCIRNTDDDETDCHHIDTYDSEAIYNDKHNALSVARSESDGHSLARDSSISNKNAALVVSNNVATDDGETVAEIDDDDDSYDSTYSVDTGEEQSVSSSSVFSIFMKGRIQVLHQNENNATAEVGGSHDDVQSKMSSGSSLINRFRHRNGLLHSKSSLSMHPINATPHHPYDHRINSHDADDDDCSVENGEQDSNIGILLTPQVLRHTIQTNASISSSQKKRNLLLQSIPRGDVDEMSTSPLALELQPLSPASIESPNIVHKSSQSQFRDSIYRSKGNTKRTRWSAFR